MDRDIQGGRKRKKQKCSDQGKAGELNFIFQILVVTIPPGFLIFDAESRKNLEQKLIFQLSGTLYPHVIDEHLLFHYFIYKIMSPYFHQWQNSFTFL